MIRIAVFEFRKIFRSRLLAVMLVLLSLLNLYRIRGEYEKQTAREECYRVGSARVYDEVSGTWDTAKIRYVTEEYEKASAQVAAGDYSTEPNQPGTHTGFVFGDMGLFGEIRSSMERLWHYGENMQALTQQAADNAAFYAEKGNTYQARLNEKIARTYQNRSVPGYYRTDGLTQYLHYDFSALLILLLMIPMLCPLFAAEHEAEMHSLLRLTQNARLLARAKLTAGAWAVGAVCALFFAEDFAAFAVLWHIRGLAQPVYALPEYAQSPLSCSIGVLLLLHAAIRLLGFAALGSFCAAVSAFCKRELLPFCLGSALVLLLVLADTFLPSPVNPVTLLSGAQSIRSFSVVRIGDTPVSAFLLPLTAGAAALILPAAAVEMRCRREI